MNGSTYVIEVWGDFACFTRPELKVERFSYPVITPSASRGIFDAIYCKPNKYPSQAEFRWQITKIEVLNPISYIALRRNEVKDSVNVNSVLRWMAGVGNPEPIWADGVGTDKKGRTQRQTMALRNVRYRLHAEIRPWSGHEGKLPALTAQFKRRMDCGKCFYQPYFGCREFPAYFSFPQSDTTPIPVTQDLGWMLYDVFDLSKPNDNYSSPFISVFKAELCDGVLMVPDFSSADVLKPREE